MATTMAFNSRQTLQRATLAAVGLAVGLALSIGFGRSRAGEGTLAPPPVGARPTIAKHATRPSSPLPQPVLDALARGKLVVLSFVMPGSELDTTASAEARAAARSSAAPFFAIDASSSAAASLLRRYELNSTPAVVVLAPPDRPTFRSSTFLDAASIRQAIRDARG